MSVRLWTTVGVPFGVMKDCWDRIHFLLLYHYYIDVLYKPNKEQIHKYSVCTRTQCVSGQLVVRLIAERPSKGIDLG